MFVGPSHRHPITRCVSLHPLSKSSGVVSRSRPDSVLHGPPQGQHRLLQVLEGLHLPLPDRVAVTAPFSSDLHHGHLRLVEAKVITDQALLMQAAAPPAADRFLPSARRPEAPQRCPVPPSGIRSAKNESGPSPGRSEPVGRSSEITRCVCCMYASRVGTVHSAYSAISFQSWRTPVAPL